MAEAMGSVLDMVTAFVAFVAGISLLFGVELNYREHHACISDRADKRNWNRKALGAKTSSIIVQFLCESAIISGIGGVIEFDRSRAVWIISVLGDWWIIRGLSRQQSF